MCVSDRISPKEMVVTVLERMQCCHNAIWKRHSDVSVFFVQIFMILAFGTSPARILTPLLLPAMLF